MSKKWDSCENTFKDWKANFIFSNKILILLSQVNERSHYRKITCNETPIEVNESKKTLNFTNKSWGNPIHNGLDLMSYDVNVISKNNIPKEFHFWFDGIHISPT
jgi:hypothetical protein